MSEFNLVIGNKNFSSWSLRPWMLMTHLGVKFRETILPLDTAQFKDQIARYSPTGRVPVLLHEDPVLQEWLLAAKSETWTVPGYEVGLVT